MSKKYDLNPNKVSNIRDEDKPFVQLSMGLLSSDAWRASSLNCRKLIDFLLIEHMNHGGLENGNLIATWKQLEEFGIRRGSIGKAIDEAEDKGLITVERKGRRGYCNSYENRFRLTFLRHKDGLYTCYPSNHFKRFKIDDQK